jgi:hypothetical protein
MARVFRRATPLGYVEGQNLIIERYSAEGHHERYAGLAREIVARNPDGDRHRNQPCRDRLQGGNQHNTGCCVYAGPARTRGWSPATQSRKRHRLPR